MRIKAFRIKDPSDQGQGPRRLGSRIKTFRGKDQDNQDQGSMRSGSRTIQSGSRVKAIKIKAIRTKDQGDQDQGPCDQDQEARAKNVIGADRIKVGNYT